MPVHKSVWNKLHRGMAYAMTLTVGFHAKSGSMTGHAWGPKGVKTIAKAFKRSDTNRSLEYDTWNKFVAKFDDLVKQRQLIFAHGASKSETDKEATWLKAIIRQYFDDTTGGQASIVKHKGTGGAGLRNPNQSFIKRIELLDTTRNKWRAVWTDEDEPLDIGDDAD
jgi:hypothetical protein